MCKLIRVKIPLLPKFKVLLRWLEYDNNFWKDSISALKNYSFKNDYFRKMVLLQLKDENRHIINEEFLNKEDEIKNKIEEVNKLLMNIEKL